MEPIKEVEVRVRCAYCGLDHKLRVKVLLAKNGETIVTVEAASDGCDVLDDGSLLQ